MMFGMERVPSYIQALSLVNTTMRHRSGMSLDSDLDLGETRGEERLSLVVAPQHSAIDIQSCQ